MELEFSLETKRSNQAVSSSVLDYKIESKRPSKRRLETPRNGYSIVIPSAPALVSPATLDGTLYNSKQMQMEGGGAYCRRSRTTKVQCSRSEGNLVSRTHVPGFTKESRKDKSMICLRSRS